MRAEELLTVKGAAKVLSVKPTTVREWLKAGKLKGVKMGRLWRIRESELEVFLSEGEEKWRVAERGLEAFLREGEEFHAGPRRHSP